MPDREKEHSFWKLQLCSKIYTVWRTAAVPKCQLLQLNKIKIEHERMNEHQKAFWHKIQNYKSSQMQLQSCSYSLICFQSLIGAAAAVGVAAVFFLFVCSAECLHNLCARLQFSRELHEIVLYVMMIRCRHTMVAPSFTASRSSYSPWHSEKEWTEYLKQWSI